MKRVLVVAAHPDDDILGCGGLLHKLMKCKCVVRVVFIAEGTSCRFSNPSAPAVSGELLKRNSCGVAALKVLGVTDVSFNDKICGRLNVVPLIDINKIVEREIEAFRPDTILTHSELDLNLDHQIVHKSVLISARPTSYDWVKNILSFEVLSSSEWNFNHQFTPNFFVRLKEDELAAKCEAMAIYETEVRPFPHPRCSESIAVLAKYRGIQSGCPLAEAYRVVRLFHD